MCSMSKNTLRNAVLGAVLTAVLSFTVVSPLFGGALAGYLERASSKRGAKVGAISGAIATVPYVLVILLGVALLFGRVGGVPLPGGIELVIVLFVVLPLAIAWNVGLSAAGGYVGAALDGRSRRASGETGGTEHGA